MPKNENIGNTSATYNDVTRRNIEPLFESIQEHISRAKFVAIDTEFTGLVLGNASPVFRFNTTEWVTRSTEMNDKYKAMTNIAKTHALVSMGMSVFSRRHVSVPGSFNVHNFNFTLQAQNSHLINPTSMAFLAQNGFDLAKQAIEGIRYFSGPNPNPVVVKTEAINKEGQMIRKIFLDLVRLRKPIVIHNGLFDLVYLYQSFFGPLPDSYESFVYDLSEMFPGGIYDTKLIAEGNDPEAASFLAYAYHRSERIQRRRALAGEPALNIRLKNRLEYDAVAEPLLPVDLHLEKDKQQYCKNFAAYGHCRYNQLCPLSHDINFILDCQECEGSDKKDINDNRNDTTGSKKRKLEEGGPREGDSKILKALSNGASERAAVTSNGTPKDKRQANEEYAIPEQDETDKESNKAPDFAESPALEKAIETMYHTAAYDAFMTGYIFASYKLQLQDALDEYKNKVYLMGRPSQPLLIKPSMYTSNSITYRQTMSLALGSNKDKAKDKPEAEAEAGAELPPKVEGKLVAETGSASE
ncbi:ribonuclease CAF1 [Coemansia spiralis]|nr:ribonuclease CAF1 [Coemansia spiralis]